MPAKLSSITEGVHVYLFNFNHKHMKKLIAVISLLSVFTSCSKNDTLHPGPTGVLENKEIFDQYLVTREENTDRIFEIKTIERNSEQLNVTVYGECTSSYYKIIWDGTVMFSDPPTVNLMVALEIPEGMVCDMSMKEQMLTVNLKDLLSEQYDRSDYVIHVLNGSKIQDKTSHPDGNVTDKN